jgi:hypothetical protein
MVIIVMDDVTAGAFNAIVRGTPDVDPQESAEAFQHKFAAQFGDARPQWLDCGWQAATTQAYSQFKFLFVYLHAPHHQVCDPFQLCSNPQTSCVTAGALPVQFPGLHARASPSGAQPLSDVFQPPRISCAIALVWLALLVGCYPLPKTV